MVDDRTGNNGRAGTAADVGSGRRDSQPDAGPVEYLDGSRSPGSDCGDNGRGRARPADSDPACVLDPDGERADRSDLWEATVPDRARQHVRVGRQRERPVARRVLRDLPPVGAELSGVDVRPAAAVQFGQLQHLLGEQPRERAPGREQIMGCLRRERDGFVPDLQQRAVRRPPQPVPVPIRISSPMLREGPATRTCCRSPT